MANLKKLTGTLLGTTKKNSPQILSGVAIAGTISTAFLAVNATPRALELIQDEEDYKGGKLTKMEVIKTTWKCYIPAVGVGALTIASIIGANSINTKRNAALAGLYSITETAFREYQNKVVETIGQNKETKIRDEVALDQINKNPPSQNSVILTGKGDVLCYDPLTDRYFKSDIEKIRQTVNELNRRLMTEMWIDLNDFYYEIGLKNTTLGDELGFHIDNDLIDVTYSAQLTEDGTPCIVLNYKVRPRYNN